MNFPDLFEEYLSHLGEKGYSEKTLITNREYMRYFGAFLEDRGITHPGQITGLHIQRYQKYLFHYRKESGEPLTFDTQSQRLLGLKRFFSFLKEKGHIDKDPTFSIELPRKRKKLPTVLTLSEVERMISSLDITTPAGVRDRAILELLFSTGMARKEITALKVRDIDFTGELVTIKAYENKKERLLPLSERAVLALQTYLLEVRPLLLTLSSLVEEDTFFIDVMTGYPLQTWAYSQIIKRAKKRASVQKKGGFDLLRGTVASLMIEGGCDIRYVQEMLGHKSPRTTRKFARLSIQKLKEVHEKTHPGNRPS